MSLALVPGPSIPICVECEHHQQAGPGKHTCTRERTRQLDIVTGVLQVVPGSVKDCYQERESHFEACCGRTARHFKQAIGGFYK
jgi:hypothetical protein